MQHFARCERPQHEFNTSAVGSLQTLAAVCADDGYADEGCIGCD